MRNPSVREIKRVYKNALENGFACPYCGIKMTTDNGFTNTLSIDHKIPRTLGGSTALSNMVACCKGCNNDKNRVEQKIVAEKREAIG